MPWSTSQLAELAGTTIKAVRHYHEVGLLDEPDRKTNGYKQYQVAHLLRLLQITRLAALGVPLAQIASLGRADKDPDEAIRVLDAELDATVTRLERIRGELALILRHRAPPEMPPGFSEFARDLSEADRSLVMIYSRIFDQSTMDELRRMLQQPSTDVDTQFQSLTPDADRVTRRRVGELLAPELKRQLDDYPALREPTSKKPQSAATANSTMMAAVQELYNPAQLEVLSRAYFISAGQTDQLEALETALDSLEVGPAVSTAAP